MKTKIRNNWTKEEIQQIYDQPLMELVYQAATVHREFHNPAEVQVCTLLSVKTGGCPEDCSYCGQAARYHTDIHVQALLPTETVIDHAKKAKRMVPLDFAWPLPGEKCVTTAILTELLIW